MTKIVLYDTIIIVKTFGGVIMTIAELKSVDTEVTNYMREREFDYDTELNSYKGELKDTGSIEPIRVQEG